MCAKRARQLVISRPVYLPISIENSSDFKVCFPISRSKLSRSSFLAPSRVFAKAELLIFSAHCVTNRVRVLTFSHTFLLLPHAGSVDHFFVTRFSPLDGRTHHWTHYNKQWWPQAVLRRVKSEKMRDRWGRWSHPAAREKQEEEEVCTETQGLPDIL